MCLLFDHAHEGNHVNFKACMEEWRSEARRLALENEILRAQYNQARGELDERLSARCAG